MTGSNIPPGPPPDFILATSQDRVKKGLKTKLLSKESDAIMTKKRKEYNGLIPFDAKTKHQLDWVWNNHQETRINTDKITWKENKPFNPVNIRFLSPQTVMLDSNDLPYLI